MAVDKIYKCDICGGVIEYNTRYVSHRLYEYTLLTEEQQYNQPQRPGDEAIYFDVCMKCIQDKTLQEIYTLYFVKREAQLGNRHRNGLAKCSESRGLHERKMSFSERLRRVINAIFGYWN